ncbi:MULTISPECIES: thymidylate synthase [unclassified Sphingobacterium]|uniref:thymidylate synthase n=1 Tax=unclassified Sphingobacterium TaxID=2609468 RepID=UPI0020C31B1C|nr:MULTISPECIES: thymidylate synthase [unclassified Sphingobacterium]
MIFESKTIDDILYSSIKSILKNGIYVQNSSKGPNFEISPSLIILKNPLARISLSKNRGKSFSPLGELLWYLNGNNELEFIKYYINKYIEFSDDGISLYGGYGPRIFGSSNYKNQFQNCFIKLSEKPDTKHAVIQILHSEDLFKVTNDLPCTNSVQFLIRDKKLNMYVNMRSNDVLYGLSHDIFCFTFLQEIMSRKLQIELGNYYHYTASLHLYEDKIEEANKYLNEGLQSSIIEMPIMPSENIDSNIKELLENEKKIRNGDYSFESRTIPQYWKDILRVLQAFNITKKSIPPEEKKALLLNINKRFSNDYYQRYIEEKILAL